MARRGRALGCCAAIFTFAALALVLVPGALALIPIKTNTTIVVADPGGPSVTYSGRLTTKLSKGKPSRETRRAARKCLRGRTVIVESDAGELGRTTSNAKGIWSVSAAKAPPGLNPRVAIYRDVRGDVLCGVILKHFEL